MMNRCCLAREHFYPAEIISGIKKNNLLCIHCFTFVPAQLEEQVKVQEVQEVSGKAIRYLVILMPTNWRDCGLS